uniref:Transcriptional regulator ATRX n=1 Tax=Stomoxys calcitrans TaxID=35570 RepID=A0A1I8PAA2_STOCA
MEEQAETNNLDLALSLDVQSSISCLNPFDRPPNIMDDELNSVTQEELEANLSTDCPITKNTESAPTSWEQLIQSVFLEDNSTQDAVDHQSEVCETQDKDVVESVITEQADIDALKLLKDEIKEIEDGGMEWGPGTGSQTDQKEMPMETEERVDRNPEITSEDTEEIEKDMDQDKCADQPDTSSDQGLSPKTEISIHSTTLLSQDEDMFNCFYDETTNDVDNELCQVEIYSSNSNENLNLIVPKSPGFVENNKIPIKEELPEDNDDILSDASSLSIGHIEESVNLQENPARNGNVQLSIINSDHCYSQEKITLNERETLKQNLINYVIQQYPTKDHERISDLVDKLFIGLDNHKVDFILESMEKQEDVHEEQVGLIAEGKEEEKEKDQEGIVEAEGNQVKTEEEQSNGNSQTIGLTVDEAVPTKVETEFSTDSQELGLDEPITNEENKNSINLPKANEVENESYEENVNQACSENTEMLETNESYKGEAGGNVNLEETEAKDNETSDNANDEKSLESSCKDITESKQLNETLVDNCSEPLEHHMFEEEFEALCKSGKLKLENYRQIHSAGLLEKLNDFATNIQRDCRYFSSASTNIDQKLNDYIQQQYKHFQEQFSAYCIVSDANKKITVETQTDFKKITKRHRRKLNLESKSNLMKTSDKSSQYDSSSSSSLSGDEKGSRNSILETTKRKKRSPKKTSIKNENNSSDPENALPNEAKQSQTNPFQEYDDGINLSQYVQSEIFDIESQQTPVPSSVEDSDASEKEVEGEGVSNNYLPDDGNDSDSTIFFKPKKNKKSSLDDTKSLSTDTKKSRTNRGDNMSSPNSESDKENQIVCSERSERKSMDEDEKNDKEIERLINIDGLAKRSVANTSTSVKSNDKSKAKATVAKNVDDGLGFMDMDGLSDDEVKSDTEEEVITEKQFLERCNEDIKRQMLDESSTDSEELEAEDDEFLQGESDEDDEDGKNSPLVDKFLKTYVVDDSDNEVLDEDDDIDLDSDKEPGEAGAPPSTKEVSNEDEPADLSIKEKELDESKISDANNVNEEQEGAHSASEIELLNDNLLFRKRGSSRPQKLDKMLSDAEKRKRISKIDEELISLSSESENSDVEEIGVESNQAAKPRAIKPMLRQDQLAGETLKAQKHENERISRLEKKHNMLDKALKEQNEVDKNKDLVLDYIKETKTFIKVHPGIVKYLKPHQFDGVRFMYDSCYGGVDSLKKSPGSGCILAHCMGLGKTLQLIALLHTVISYKELKTTKVLVLCPKSTVMNWADEIVRWLGPLRQKNLKVYTFNDTSDIYEKLSILKEWSQSNQARAGCLLIGYEAFRTLVFYHSYKNRGNVSAHRLEEIRKNVNTYLLQPGADLVICDEGHIIKNSKSAISMAVAQIVTPRRIVLTGTPIQNNLKEYYSMVNFIKPLFLGTEKEFANLYANPIKNGQHKDSGKTDIKIMKQRSFVLHKKLSKFVQRKEAELLKTFLPQKFEYVLFIPMTEVQNNLYQHILSAITNRDENYRGKGLITDYTCLRKIWTHPKVLEDAWKNAVNQRNKKEIRQKQKDHNSDDDQPDDIYDSQTGQMSVTNDWWRSLLTERDLESIMPSNKLRTMFKILQMCEEKGEKCLIFSAFVAVLNVVEYFFRKITENDETVRKELGINSSSQWILGKDYYRLDGKTPKSIRHAMINEFNNVLNKTARVFLISAKAGGQGINLIGANRVIILDTSWNPSNDQQNIFRVFRLGQKRNCYIYRLLAMGTMEEKVYSRSVTKQAMSFRVVDEQQIDRHYNMAELAELYILTIPDHSNRPTPILPQDSILARLLRSFPDLVYKYHEHDSLLENKVEQELSEQEKNEAWTAYERDLQMNSEINEKQNIEDLQNKFNAPNLANYLSPFSGLDVSTSNTNNNNTGKNMSSLFGSRGFNQPLLQSLLGPNSTPSTTQQYLDMLAYYKNFNAYADLNSYSTLSGIGAGRMPVGPSTSSAANPLAALGDLSMYGLPSSALQGLGATSAATSMSLANSVLAGALPPMPSVVSSAAPAPMYTSPAPSSVANVALSSAGLTNTTNTSAALNAFEQYQQSLRNTFPNMYSYAGDFGIGSSGSTILDKSKSGKNSKHSNSSGNKNTINLPGGSKVNPMGMFPGSAMYMPQHQQQQQQPQQQQQQHQSRPSSRNTPTELSNKSKAQTPSSSSSLAAYPPTSNSTSTVNLTSAVNTSSASTMSISQVISNASKSNTSDTSNSLINYRRSEPNSNSSGPTKTVQQTSNSSTGLGSKRTNADQTNNSNSNIRTSASSNSNSTPNSKQLSSKTLNPSTPVQQQQQQSHASKPVQSSNPVPQQNSSNQRSSQKSSHTNQASSNMTAKNSSNSDNGRSTSNIGILYPNSKGHEKTGASKPNSPMNMGIVYPRSSSKNSNSEMQIIPTSSPPGTTSIAKQLNDLSPSISLTAVKNSGPNNKNVNSSAKPNAATQNMQLNKVLQNNTTIRRTTSPVAMSGVNSSKPPSNGNTNSNSSSTTPTSTQNHSNILARFKAANSKTSTNNGNNINNPPPLHRANTTFGMTKSSTVNISAKPSSGLTITNIKSGIKPSQNIQSKQQLGNGGANQASTLAAKQQAAASVAKSSIQRTSTSSSGVNNPSTPHTSNLQRSSTSSSLSGISSIKRAIIKRTPPNTPSATTSNKLPAALSSPSVTVTSSNKLPIISSVKSMSPAMATITKTSVTKSNQPAVAQSKQNINSVSNVSKALAQMQKRLPSSLTATASNPSSTSSSTSASNSLRNTVNIRPVDNKLNSTAMGGGVYIIETNINDKKVAIGAPTKSGGGTTVTKVPLQNPNKRKNTDPLSKDTSIDSKRMKN